MKQDPNRIHTLLLVDILLKSHCLLRKHFYLSIISREECIPPGVQVSESFPMKPPPMCHEIELYQDSIVPRCSFNLHFSDD